MINNINIPKIIGMAIIICIISVIILIIKTIFFKDQTTNEYLKPVKHDIQLKLNGDYVEYLNIGDDYKEKGVKSLSKKQINISYYKNNQKVIKIDTIKPAVYTVKYGISMNNKQRTITKTVVIRDNKKPNITFPETTNIITNQVMTYNLLDNVIATDNSENVKLIYKGELKNESGNYIITYKATDDSGNKTIKKRLIKVLDGISIENENNSLIIHYPKNEEYKYYYSIDNGQTFLEASENTILNNVNTNIIASVYKNDTYITSITYQKGKE